jgi:hypothetical protein
VATIAKTFKKHCSLFFYYEKIGNTIGVEKISSKSSTHYLNDTIGFKLQYVASVGSG